MSKQGSGSGRLGDERVQVLAGWGRGLAAGGRDEELRAAGRAIVLLVEEINALKRDLWHARAGVSSELGSVEPERSDSRREMPAQTAEPVEGLGLIEALTLRLTADLPALP